MLILGVVVCFVDIGGIVDHHCIEVVVCFVDIGGEIDFHHCLNFIFIKFIITFYKYN